jgi:chemotaxis protein CheX
VRPELIHQLDAAVAEVFQMMLGRSCQPQECVASERSGFNAEVLFSGTMRGQCSIHLDEQTAGQLTAELIGFEGSDESADTVGELCNMIAGGWKSRLKEERASCGLSSPKVTSGRKGRAEAPAHHERLFRCYQFDGSCLMLELSFE